jgi:hypothetical protein
VNLGTLVLGRSIERVGEMALRTALGASRGALDQAARHRAGLCSRSAAPLPASRSRARPLPALVSQIPAEVPHAGQIAL